MEPKMSGSSKRAKAPGNIIQDTYCLVDGCSSDLSQCREYHRRHKVCETHSKTTKVTIGGREQRFCQQCSRFHSLIEFNEGKRSCTKSLDRHNWRRKKPQLGSVSRIPGPLISSQQGVQILSFLESFTSSIVSSISNDAANADKNLLTFSNQKDSNYIIVRQNSSSEALSQNKIVNQLQFLPTMESVIPNTSIQQTFNPNCALANIYFSQKMESDCCDHVVSSDLLSPFCHWSTP